MKLSAHGKYKVLREDKLNPPSAAVWGSGTKLIDDFVEFTNVTT